MKLAKNILSFERVGYKYAIAEVADSICGWKVLEKKKLTNDCPAMFCVIKGKKVIKDNAIYWQTKRLCYDKKYCFDYIQFLLGKTKVEPKVNLKNSNLEHLANKFKF